MPHRRYTFVLIHGSWHDGGLWAPVAEHLRRLGHGVHTPTIAGHGRHADKDVTHDQAVASIVDYLNDHDLDDFVLVGHSFGGTIISKVAEVMPERIRRLVFFGAFVLQDGNSVADEIPPRYAELFRQLVTDGAIPLPYEIWRDSFINDADHELAEESFARLSPEPVAMMEDKVSLRRFYELIEAGRLRCSYLNCTEDVAMPHGEYAWHPRFSARLGLCRLVQMGGSHEVMFTDPTGLATKIVEAGRD